MREKILNLKENKKALILFILILFMICIGISYAYWYLTHIQSGTNQVVTDCFDIEFIEESEAITLSKAYPMTDEEGSTLTPYTFKISNKCASYVSYQVNLEILNTTTLDSQYVKGMIDTNAKVLTENEVVQTTLDNATTSYKLTTGYLDHNEERTHTFRLWIDENVGMDDPVSNKTFEGKITITASYITEIPTDYDLCVEKYGEDSINCNIIAQLDDTGACPEVNEDGTVEATSTEKTNSYLCSAPDDYGTSYYYRGTVENNWVKFAGYYWRILRINGDNSIRMIYAGDASVIDALDNKEEVLKNGYNDSSTDYTQIGTSRYNYYWKKDNVQESVNSQVSDDNAGVGYMYGNRDGIVEGSTQYVTYSHAATSTQYYAKEYTYDAVTDRFTLKDPVGLLGTEITEDYVGWYTMNSTRSSSSNSFVYKVTSVEPSDGSSNARIGYSSVRYGTTSKEKAQTNTNDSDIKEAIDEWYESHIKGTEYEQYLSDTLFCNDRSLGSNTSSSYSQLGYGTEATKYRPYSASSNGITLNCVQQNDRFTLNNEIIGNSDLMYPIGLVTEDEIDLAGGYNTNVSYYLYTGNIYWTMTPRSFSSDSARVQRAYGNYVDNLDSVNNSFGIRPVINLKPNSLKLGDGTASNPYQIG